MASNINIVQFNARISKILKRQIKTDAARLEDFTIDTIAESIIAKFYRDNPTETQRAAIYRKHLAAPAA